jgi:tetratricopeptide (TPR) repeat protein
LVRLVDKSLVVADEAEGEVTRYRLLETLRQYGQERLVSQEDAKAVYRRHAAHYLALAEEAEDEVTRYRLTGREQVAWWLAWLSRMAAEQDNLRDALRWLLHRGATEESLRLITALARFWEGHSDWDEGFAWLEQALALPGAAQARALPSALAMTGWFALVRSAPTARGLFEEAVLLGRELDDRSALARALMGLGLLASYQSDFQQARTLLQESLAHYRALGNWGGIIGALCDLARLDSLAGDQALARTHLDEAQVMMRGAGEHRSVAFALEVRGEVAFAMGDTDEAGRLWEESLHSYHRLGNMMGVASVENLLGHLAVRLEDYGTAHIRYRASLEHQRGFPRLHWTICSLAGLAAVAAAGGQTERALRLAAACLALGEGAWSPFRARERALVEWAMETVRAALEEQAATAAWEEGRTLTLEEAVSLALEATGTVLQGS